MCIIPGLYNICFEKAILKGCGMGGGVIPVDITQICRFGRMIDSAENDLDIEQ